MRFRSAAPLPRSFLRYRQIAQFANLPRWYEAGSNQPVPQQTGQPLTILVIGLLSRQRPHMLRVGQNQSNVTFQNVPHRLPIGSRTLHHRHFTVCLFEPFRELLQLRTHRPESAGLRLWLLIRRPPPQTSRDTAFVNIDSATYFVMDAHGSPPDLSRRPTFTGAISDPVTRSYRRRESARRRKQFGVRTTLTGHSR